MSSTLSRVGSIEKLSTGPSVRTQVSRLEPPRCIDTLSSSALATRVMPPAMHVPAAAVFGDGIHAHHRGARHRGACAARPVPARSAPSRCTVQASGSSSMLDLVGPHDRRGPAAARKGAAHDLAAQRGLDVVPGRRLAAPPGGQRRQQQFLAEQAARDAGQEALDRRRFEEAVAQRIGHHHVAGAHRLQQPGHAQRRVGAQLQRVAPVVVQAAQHAVHRLQAFHRLQEQALLAHHQVAALDQRQPQVARQVGMLEVGLGVGPGRQQHHARRGAARHLARRAFDRIEQPAVAGGDVLHAQLAEGVGELARDDQPVVQHVAQARRALAAAGQHLPAAVGCAHQVEGDDVQTQPAGRHARRASNAGSRGGAAAAPAATGRRAAGAAARRHRPAWPASVPRAAPRRPR